MAQCLFLAFLEESIITSDDLYGLEHQRLGSKVEFLFFRPYKVSFLGGDSPFSPSPHTQSTHPLSVIILSVTLITLLP